MKLYMFRIVRLSIIKSLFTVRSAMVYVIQVCRQLSSRTRMELRSILVLLSVQWTNSWWWTDELSETCRVSWENKFVKLVHLVGFITKKYVNWFAFLLTLFVQYIAGKVLLSVAPYIFQTAHRGSNNYKKFSCVETTSGIIFYHFSLSKMWHRFSKRLHVRYTNSPVSLQTAPIESTVFTKNNVPPGEKVPEKLLKFLFRKLGILCVQETCISDTSPFYTAFHKCKKQFSVIGYIFSKTIYSSSSIEMHTEISGRVRYRQFFFFWNGVSYGHKKFLLLRYLKKTIGFCTC